MFSPRLLSRATSRLAFRGLSTEAAPENVKQIVDQICQLNLMEVRHLNQLLRDKLDIPEFSMGAIPMAAMQGGAAPAAEEGDAQEAKSDVQTKFAVKLVEFDKIIKIKLIKEIRALTDMGLKEAKDLVESVPCEIVKDIDKTKAEELAKVLKEVGAVVTIE